jgi:hypothetical protein
MNFLFKTTILVAIILGVVALSGMQHLYAKSQPAYEYEVKAAFIYNFLKFIEWSNDKNINDTSILYIIGKNPFGSNLKKTLSVPIHNKECEIRYIKSIKGFPKSADFHVLFISSSQDKYLPQILEMLKDSKILTIGDTKGFAQRGVIINFYIEENKVRFEINVDAAKRAKLKVSSKLLRLAKIVHDTPNN